MQPRKESLAVAVYYLVGYAMRSVMTSFPSPPSMVPIVSPPARRDHSIPAI